MINKVFLLVFFYMHGFILFADTISEKHYPGSSVVKQEIENHQAMLKTLQNLMLHLPAGNKTCKSSIEELTNYTKAALISFEYLDSLWERKGRKLPKNEKSPHFSASLPCSCNGTGNCKACGGDGYVWTAVEKGKEIECKKCHGGGRNGKHPCADCKGSGWANAHPTSPQKN
ncbi:MAG: hypothetical protein HQM10_12775 [Candidatus Riflebacteria bacterium]|nr:hypothetical protein [Candidatus Riflebacteria bacterium]